MQRNSNCSSQVGFVADSFTLVRRWALPSFSTTYGSGSRRVVPLDYNARHHHHIISYHISCQGAPHRGATIYVKNVKSFPSHKAHRAALISVSLALSQTPAYTARPRIRSWCIARCACLRASFRRYSLHLPTEGWPG